MIPILIALGAFVSTMTGGVVALKNQSHLHSLLGYTAGVLLGVVAFDLLPEIFHLLKVSNGNVTYVMIALVSGFLLFHIVEKSILIHHDSEDYGHHHHPQVGLASALALSGHSFLDGVGIGLGFHVSPTIGVAVAIAVIAHDFTDGLNTVNLMLLNQNRSLKALSLLLLDAIAPVLGVLATYAFTLSEASLTIYLGFFAGFLLYIGASDILPEAHNGNSSFKTIGLTILGVLFMFAVTRFA